MSSRHSNKLGFATQTPAYAITRRMPKMLGRRQTHACLFQSEVIKANILLIHSECHSAAYAAAIERQEPRGLTGPQG
jgi:hypothetical protein